MRDCRWVVQSGCRPGTQQCGGTLFSIEDLQLESAEHLEKALAVLSIVAWRLMWLLCHSRVHPDDSSGEYLEPHERQLFYAKEHRGKAEAKHPPTMQQAVLWIAKLGGFLARKGDGDPGIKTLWRGLQRLNDMAETWKLARASLPLMGNGQVSLQGQSMLGRCRGRYAITTWTAEFPWGCARGGPREMCRDFRRVRGSFFCG